jgi:hypothetical protein
LEPNGPPTDFDRFFQALDAMHFEECRAWLLESRRPDATEAALGFLAEKRREAEPMAVAV